MFHFKIKKCSKLSPILSVNSNNSTNSNNNDDDTKIQKVSLQTQKKGSCPGAALCDPCLPLEALCFGTIVNEICCCCSDNSNDCCDC